MPFGFNRDKPVPSSTYFSKQATRGDAGKATRDLERKAELEKRAKAKAERDTEQEARRRTDEDPIYIELAAMLRRTRSNIEMTGIMKRQAAIYRRHLADVTKEQAVDVAAYQRERQTVAANHVLHLRRLDEEAKERQIREHEINLRKLRGESKNE
jgi:hypothetical protein